MASRQLGRLRQWAGEVMSSRDSKTFVTEEFKELEHDIEVRKEGMLKIQSASEIYLRSLSKRKSYESLGNNEKFLPIDILGVVMIVHGEEFGEDSTFGTSLVKLGRAHCKAAALQEAYAVTFQDTFISSIQRFGDGIKQYEHLKKKLEGRRSAFEAALTKADKLKQSKKDKDRMDAEEEMERAKQRYDETVEDIRAHMEAIRDDDAFQLHELTAFLDLEMNYVAQYLEVLKDVKSEWAYGSHNNIQKRPVPSLPLSRRSSGNAMSSKDPYVNVSPDSSDDENEQQRSKFSRQLSFRHNKGESTTNSKPPSRPTSRLSRKRTSSSATNVSEKEKDKDKDNGGEKHEKNSRKLSVAGWASSAVESVTNRTAKKNKDKESFATLDEGENGTGGGLKKSSSIASLGRKTKKAKDWVSPKVTPQILKSKSLGQGQDSTKIVRAKFDFEAKSPNELSFRVGDEIIVLNETLDDWWMGDMYGKTGLFPTAYVEIVKSGTARASIPSPPVQLEKQTLRGAPVPSGMDDVSDGYGWSDLDEEKDLASNPMSVYDGNAFTGRPTDSHSILSMTTDDDEGPIHHSVTHTPKMKYSVPYSHHSSGEDNEDFDIGGTFKIGTPIMMNSSSPNTAFNNYIHHHTTPTKKVPPPPPPRRISNAHLQPLMVAPLIPERKNVSTGGSSINSSISSLHLHIPGSGSGNSSGIGVGIGIGGDRSPFESTLDLGNNTSTLPPPTGPTYVRPNGSGGGNGNGKDTNPFRNMNVV